MSHSISHKKGGGTEERQLHFLRFFSFRRSMLHTPPLLLPDSLQHGISQFYEDRWEEEI